LKIRFFHILCSRKAAKATCQLIGYERSVIDYGELFAGFACFRKFSDSSSGHAAPHFARGDVAAHDRPGCYDGTVAYGSARQQYAARAYPHAVAYCDRQSLRAFSAMVDVFKTAERAYQNALADAHGRDSFDAKSLIDECVAAYAQPARVMYEERAANARRESHARARQPQQERPYERAYSIEVRQYVGRADKYPRAQYHSVILQALAQQVE
jgi:hypothetical protein